MKNSNIRSQLHRLQDQLDDAAHAIEKMGGHRMRRRWRRVRRRTSDLGREAGDLAQQHPAVSSLIVVGVLALAAACYYYSQDR